MPQDDGWAYARSVEHLLATGRYRLDEWSAANMPVQIYWAAGLAKVFGYSFAVLTASTLLLLAVALAAFHALLREFDIPPPVASALTLSLLGNPLVFMLAFTFMSDVQFLAWLVVAMWLYVRGLRLGRESLLFAGSLAAAAAIGTRQFGIALVAGIVVAWLLVSPSRRPPWRALVAAVAAPLAMSAWQLQAGLTDPTFTQAFRLHEQADFVHLPPLELAREFAWRAAIVLQYVAMSLLPALPILAIEAWRRVWPGSTSGPGARSWPALAVLAACFAAGMFALAAYSPVSSRETTSRLLPLPWMLPTALWDHRWVRRALAIIGLAGAPALVLLALGATRQQRRWRDLGAPALLVIATGMSMVCLHLAYVQLNDTYIVGLLPFSLLLIGVACRRSTNVLKAARAATVLAVAVSLGTALWLRGEYNRLEAQWHAADKMLAAGVGIHCIGGPRHWMEYHGAFDEWVGDTYPAFDHTAGRLSPAEPGPLHDPFYDWLHDRFWNASVRIEAAVDALPPGWRVLEEAEYRNVFLVRQPVRTLARVDAAIGDPRCLPIAR